MHSTWWSDFKQHNPDLAAALPWLVLLTIALFGWNAVIELRAEEPRRAVVALEMYLRDMYIVPEIHGEPYFNKPPLFNWLVAGSFWLFGHTGEWAVRFPATLAFLALAYGQFRVVRNYLGKSVALWSALITLTAADLLFYGTVNTGEIDLFFALVIFAQAAALFHFSANGKWLIMYVICYGLAAIGTLTKGLPAIAFLVLSVLPWVTIAHHWQKLFSLAHLAGIAVFAMLIGGYFWAYSLQGDALGFALQLFFEATQRVEGASSGSILKSLWVFPALIFKILLPWSLFAFLLLRKGFWKAAQMKPLVFFCLIFLIANTPIYWLANYQKERYLYAFVPFLAIMLAYGISLPANGWQSKMKSGLRRFFQILIPIVAIGVLSIPFIPTFSEIDFLWIKAILVFSIGAAAYWLSRRNGDIVIGLFAFMVFLRMGANFFYLPVLADQSSRMIYREAIAEVISITGNNPVYWLGVPFEFQAEASFFGVSIAHRDLTTPPLVAYQVPYYLSASNGITMEYRKFPNAIGFYLTHEAELLAIPSFTELYRFHDHWVGQDLVLFRVEI